MTSYAKQVASDEQVDMNEKASQVIHSLLEKYEVISMSEQKEEEKEEIEEEEEEDAGEIKPLEPLQPLQPLQL